MAKITKQYAATFSAFAAGCPVAGFLYIHFLRTSFLFYVPCKMSCQPRRHIARTAEEFQTHPRVLVRQHTRTIPLTSEW